MYDSSIKLSMQVVLQKKLNRKAKGVKMVVFKMNTWSMNIMYTMKIGQMELQAVVNRTRFVYFLFRRMTLSSRNCIRGMELTYRGANMAKTVATAQPELLERNN